jgi:hypothetical protein
MKRKRLVSHFDLHGNGNFGKRKVKNVGSHDASREGLLLTRFDLDTIYVHRKDGKSWSLCLLDGISVV